MPPRSRRDRAPEGRIGTGLSLRQNPGRWPEGRAPLATGDRWAPHPPAATPHAARRRLRAGRLPAWPANESANPSHAPSRPRECPGVFGLPHPNDGSHRRASKPCAKITTPSRHAPRGWSSAMRLCSRDRVAADAASTAMTSAPINAARNSTRQYHAPDRPRRWAWVRKLPYRGCANLNERPPSRISRSGNDSGRKSCPWSVPAAAATAAREALNA